ncbi:Uncharacterised protein [uncultured archaeon]|nr:Uncharacterised protein [uncultured archaeon]
MKGKQLELFLYGTHKNCLNQKPKYFYYRGTQPLGGGDFCIIYNCACGTTVGESSIEKKVMSVNQ